MGNNVVIVYGSGASYASGYKVNINHVIDGIDNSACYAPPTDQNLFKIIPDEYIKLSYRALFYFKNIYYPPNSNGSMEKIWTDVDINHKHITLDTYNWKKESEVYSSAIFFNDKYYKSMDRRKNGPYLAGPLMYNEYKFLGDCGRDFRRLIHDIYSNYTTPEGNDYFKILHDSLDKTTFNNISYLTFNYDCYLEESLKERKLKYIALNDRTDCYKSLTFDGIPVIKLHGSLNWEEMRRDYLYNVTYHAFPYSRETQIEPKYENDDNWRQPAIIPPTIFKQEINDDSRLNDDLTKTILQQWRAAITVLAKADLIIIVGYSFPIADHHVARLFRISNMIKKRDKQTALKLLYCCGPNDVMSDRQSILTDIYGMDAQVFIVKGFENLIESEEFLTCIS